VAPTREELLEIEREIWAEEARDYSRGPYLFQIFGGQEGYKFGLNDVHIRIAGLKAVAVAVDWGVVHRLAQQYGYDRRLEDFCVLPHRPSD